MTEDRWVPRLSDAEKMRENLDLMVEEYGGYPCQNPEYLRLRKEYQAVLVRLGVMDKKDVDK